MTATDTGISVTPEALVEKLRAIEEIDATLDAASGSQAGGIRALRNQIVRDNAENESIQNFVSQVVENLQNAGNQSGEALVTLYVVLSDVLDDKFKAQVDTFLNAQVEARKSEQPDVKPEELSALTEQRKELVQQYNALRNILTMFGQDVSGIAEPKKRTGAVGPRGKHELSKFSFAVDGETLPDDQNSMSGLASKYNMKVKEFKDALTAKNEGLDLSKKGLESTSEFQATLPDGKILVAKKVEA